ncbi:MAG TPA: VacJ family lipoprotein [Steroidobacteraceae bacterium]
MKPLALVLIACGVLAGCVSPTLTIRRLPPDTPAADNAAAIARATRLAASASSAQSAAAASVPESATEVPPFDSYDPWERANRAVYRFNARFDEAIFLPVANHYRRLPAPMRTGVHNFFGNLSEPDTIANDVLQWRLGAALRAAGRFVVNSTVGIGGLLDVAATMPLRSAATGFGDTLSTWGLHPGPYLVIPVLGPATLRDGIGMLGDYALAYELNLADLYRGYQSYALATLNAVDQRANTDFRYYASGSPFDYDTVRFLYVHRELIEDQARRR